MGRARDLGGTLVIFVPDLGRRLRVGIGRVFKAAFDMTFLSRNHFSFGSCEWFESSNLTTADNGEQYPG